MKRRGVVPAALACLAVSSLTLAACSEVGPTPTGPGEAAIRTSHGASPARQGALATLRQQTARFHNMKHAMAAGYDFEATGCLDDPSVGGMGFHYTKSATNLIDGTVDLLEPEFLVFSPENGRIELTAVEYVVPFDAWDGLQPPSLLGRSFHEHATLPVWILHMWIWRHNPLGMFADYNPKIELCS